MKIKDEKHSCINGERPAYIIEVSNDGGKTWQDYYPPKSKEGVPYEMFGREALIMSGTMSYEQALSICWGLKAMEKGSIDAPSIKVRLVTMELKYSYTLAYTGKSKIIKAGNLK